MEKNKILIVGVVALIIGLCVGNLSSKGGYFGRDLDNSRGGSVGNHQMGGGRMMDNDQSMDMAEMMGDMNEALRGKTGDEFDQAFLAEMIVHHEGAVDMANLALTNAKHQEIKTLANAIISAQNTEIASMKGWLKTWYNK